ncbi:MAG: thiamine diphosphokinase [Clostridia bacterium]|nr:thiamine diphosphokinase [Clostridia bacterium]
MRALIVGSGDLTDKGLLHTRHQWADRVIAADGGAKHLLKAGLKPHILLGDFDSLARELLEKIKESETEILSFPTKKDFTDMELAIDLAIERGAEELVILGASGSRLDHTLANIFLLTGLTEKGIKACLEDSHNQIFAIKDEIRIQKQENRKVSLVALSPTVEGLSTQGLAYPLSDATLRMGVSLGVSNEFEADEAVVSIKKGLLLVFVSKD